MRSFVVVFYGNRGTARLRVTIQEHLYCLDGKDDDVMYVNLAFPVPWGLLEKLHVRAVIFNTTFLALRWSLPFFEKKAALVVQRIKHWNCPKIAIPQDEFLQTEPLSRFLDKVGVTHIYSCAPASEWPLIYPYQQGKKVYFERVLTGYLSDRVIEYVKKTRMSGVKQFIEIGYRACEVDYWLGTHGRSKVEIASRVEKAAKKRGLKTDISLKLHDVLSGMEWFKFLLSCRATIGVEGGASILDRDGMLREKVENWRCQNPKASFQEVWHEFLREHEGFKLFALSPRHLEAALTRTAQILIEGEYNGVLEANKHYIPLKKDYSNLEECFDKLEDVEEVEKMTERAYRDVVLSKRYTYDAFVEQLRRAFPLPTKEKSFSLKTFIASYFLKIWDVFLWGVLYLLDVQIGNKRIAWECHKKLKEIRTLLKAKKNELQKKYKRA